jgi:hypothetical protein
MKKITNEGFKTLKVKQLEKLFKDGKLNHIKNATLTSSQCENIDTDIAIDMIKNGILYTETTSKEMDQFQILEKSNDNRTRTQAKNVKRSN